MRVVVVAFFSRLLTERYPGHLAVIDLTHMCSPYETKKCAVSRRSS